MSASNPFGTDPQSAAASRGFPASQLASPAFNAAAVTPDDNNDLSTVARALYIGGTGDVHLVTVNGQTAVFVAVPTGSVLPVMTARVLTATTATNIVAMW